MLDVMSLAEISGLGADDVHEYHGNLEAFDDVTIEPVQPKLVMSASSEELKYFNEMGVQVRVHGGVRTRHQQAPDRHPSDRHH